MGISFLFSTPDLCPKKLGCIFLSLNSWFSSWLQRPPYPVHRSPAPSAVETSHSSLKSAHSPARRSVLLSARPSPPSRLLDAPLQLGRTLVPSEPASSTRNRSQITFPTASSSQVLPTPLVAQWKPQRRTLAT